MAKVAFLLNKWRGKEMERGGMETVFLQLHLFHLVNVLIANKKSAVRRTKHGYSAECQLVLSFVQSPPTLWSLVAFSGGEKWQQLLWTEDQKTAWLNSSAAVSFDSTYNQPWPLEKWPDHKYIHFKFVFSKIIHLIHDGSYFPGEIELLLTANYKRMTTSNSSRATDNCCFPVLRAIDIARVVLSPHSCFWESNAVKNTALNLFFIEPLTFNFRIIINNNSKYFMSFINRLWNNK